MSSSGKTTESRCQNFESRGKKLTAAEKKTRSARLLQSTKTLYHETDLEAAKLIKSTLKLLRGKGGLGGAGIYFAVTPEDAKRKANSKGALITCKVHLGNVKTISANGDSTVTFSKLFNEGYDSVLIPRKAGDEYVVYNADQAEVLEIKDTASGTILYDARAAKVNPSPRHHNPLSRWQSESALLNQLDGGSNSASAGSKQYQPFVERSHFEKSPLWPARQDRLKKAQRMILFNITDEATARKIANSHKLLRENGGIAGAGIYLYANSRRAEREMTGDVIVMVTCGVKLGNVKRLSPQGDLNITFTSLFNEGFDSVCIPSSEGDLFVVYNSDQVRVQVVRNTQTGNLLYSSAAAADDDDVDDSSDAVSAFRFPVAASSGNSKLSSAQRLPYTEVDSTSRRDGASSFEKTTKRSKKCTIM